VPEGVEIVYGRRPVAEARRGRRRVHRIWTRAELDEGGLTRLAGSPDHQGIVAEVDPYPYASAGSLLEPDEALVVALDGVQDPRNLGAICRAAEAAGAAGVVIPTRRAARVTAAACKASAGAVEHLAVARVTNLVRWLEGAKSSGAWVYGAAADGPTTFTEADLRGRCVIVLGGEGRGLRRLVAERCDGALAIPLAGRIDSLNVATAAAVLLFEAVRQRQGDS
jgi:23S rRNA (guanosine2251-2'-O)-methyltransferase